MPKFKNKKTEDDIYTNFDPNKLSKAPTSFKAGMRRVSSDELEEQKYKKIRYRQKQFWDSKTLYMFWIVFFIAYCIIAIKVINNM